MKVSMEDAAYIIGKSKKTIYNHKDKGRFSYEIDENERAVVDASELLRVYGDKPPVLERMKEIEEREKGGVSEGQSTPNYKAESQKKTRDSLSVEEQVKQARLEAEIESMKALMKKSEEHNEFLKDMLEDEKEERRKANMLLQDLRSQVDQSKDERVKDVDTLKQTVEELRKQNRRIMYELQAQKSMSVWQRVFGGKPGKASVKKTG
jgi:hypothetical protein